MSNCYIGEIRAVAFTFAPVGWALCDGSILSIADNGALFNLIGTTYGGDGINTFGLPNLQSRIPVGQGTGPGLSPRVIAQAFGAEGVVLNQLTMAPHTHALMASTAGATTTVPTGALLAVIGSSTTPFYSDGAGSTTLAPETISPYGGTAPHENRQPFQAQNFIIALTGTSPTAS